MGYSGSSRGDFRGSGKEAPEEKIARLEEENAGLREQNAVLAERLSALEHRLGLNSGNSGQPPSSDGLKKPRAERRTRSLRGRTGRKPGGQSDHKGHTLSRTALPDRAMDHVPEVCRGCGGSLSGAACAGSAVSRQVFDLPQPRPLEVTEHRSHACRCARCGTVTRGSFPEGVTGPVQYGPRLSALAVWLRHTQFLPERRVSEVLEVLFGARVSPACGGRAYRDACGDVRAREASGRDGVPRRGPHRVASCDLHAASCGLSGERAPGVPVRGGFGRGVWRGRGGLRFRSDCGRASSGTTT